MLFASDDLTRGVAQGPFNPFEDLSDSTKRDIRMEIWRNPDLLLQIQRVRELVADDRANRLLEKSLRTGENKDGQVARGTVEHNLEGARHAASLDRPMTLVSTAMGIERVRRDAPTLRVLSIGPRSEIELFALRAAGFRWENIIGLDLISYSPLVKVGDVHAMPFADSSFDILFMGWVLAYSKDHPKAVSEVIRVLKPGGIAIVASDFSSEETHTRDRVDSTHMQTSDQMLALFGDHIRYVFAKHDPRQPDIHMIKVAVEIKK
jgi:SAM-dependent methyltransferase